jgi:hypothetical protein
MTLVRTFVRRETDIAIDTIGTILWRKIGHSRVKHGDFPDDFFHQLIPTGLTFQELVLVSIEPFTIIVCLKLTKVCDDFFHILSIMYSGRKVTKNRHKQQKLTDKTFYLIGKPR